MSNPLTALADRPPTTNPELSVVVPMLNEEPLLPQTCAQLHAELGKIGRAYEIIFVDDGSTDRSREIIAAETERDPRVRLVVLSRNFGHEMATTAGLAHARGKAAIVIDADLQDPPELMHEFVRLWDQGYDVVYGVRQQRKGEGPMKRLTAFLFYRLMRKLSDVPIPADTGDFRLMDRKVLDVFNTLREDPRFFRGLIAWIGFKQIGVPFVRQPRVAGYSKYRPARLLRLALDTITSFSTFAVFLGTVAGLVFAALSAGVAVALVAASSAGQIHVPAWGWVALGFLGLWHILFLYVAFLGEYIVRMHRHTQHRPLYVVDRVIERHSAQAATNVEASR